MIIINKVKPNQFHNAYPYNQPIYQFDSRERDTYISRAPARLLKGVGNDLILRGFYPRNIEFVNNILSIEICKGILIQDSTLIETNEDKYIEIDTSLYNLTNGYFIIHTEYDFDKTFSDNNRFNIIIQYLSKIDYKCTPYGWNKYKNRIYLGLLEYNGQTFDFNDFYDILIYDEKDQEDKRYYLRGITNFSLLHLTYETVRHYGAFIFDTIDVLSMQPPIPTGEIIYENTNWMIADSANLNVFNDRTYYDLRYVLNKPILDDKLIESLNYNIHFARSNLNIQTIDFLGENENKQNVNLKDIADNYRFINNEYQLRGRHMNLVLDPPNGNQNLCDPYLFPPVRIDDPFLGFGGDYGYICSGFHTHQYTSICRMTFSFDSSGAQKVGVLSSSRYSSASCNSSNCGFVCGGKKQTPSLSHLSYISRFIFPFDQGESEDTLNLSYSRGDCSGFNSSKHGYVAGGRNRSYIERFTFPAQTGSIILNSNLSQSLTFTSSNNSSNFGFICGGFRSSASRTYINRYSFPFNSGQTSILFHLRRASSKTSANNSSRYGYVCHNDITLTQNRLQRFDFNQQSGRCLEWTLGIKKENTSANNSSFYGYVCGGKLESGFATTNIDRFIFPFDGGNTIYCSDLNGSRWKTCALDGVDFVTMLI